MRLFLEVASESVASQYLQCTEEYEMAQSVAEVYLVNRQVFLQGSDILVKQFLAQSV